MALTKAEIAEALFDQLGLNKREARELVDLFFEELRASLAATASVVSGISINRETTARAASGLLLATDVADYLVAKGISPDRLEAYRR